MSIYIYIFLHGIYVCDCVLSNSIHVRSLSCILFDYGVNKGIITKKIIVKGPCDL
jgi:hypothetical protein